MNINQKLITMHLLVINNKMNKIHNNNFIKNRFLKIEIQNDNNKKNLKEILKLIEIMMVIIIKITHNLFIID